jgi:O-antigen/teichoic acid export membrane protein
MSVRRALVLSFLDRYAGLILSVVASMAVARLLTPTEIGVFSVVMATLALASTLRDLGAGQYLLQESALTTAKIQSVWAVQMGIGALLAVVCLLASQPLAWFYGDERMFGIMGLLALNYLINPFGSITYAWLMREMRFDALAWGRFLSGLAGAVVSVGLAWWGHGPISLAWGSLATTVTNAAVLSCYRPANFPWRPGLQHLRDVLRFGSRLTGASVIQTITSGAPEFMLGKLHNLAEAGYFSRANGLVAMFRSLVSDAVNAVTLPLFAKTAREDGDLGATFAQVLAYMSVVGWAFSGVVFVLAEPLVRLLYGAQWDAAVPIVRWLALALIFQVPLGTCSNLLVSKGASGPLLSATARSCLVTLLGIVLAAPAGMTMVALAMVPASAVGLLLWLAAVRGQVDVPWLRLARTSIHSGSVALLTTAAAWGAAQWTAQQQTGRLIAVLLALALASLTFLATMLLTRHPLAAELGRLAPRRRARPAP